MSRSKKSASSEVKSVTRKLIQFSEQFYTLSRLDINQRLQNQDIKYGQWLILNCLMENDVCTPSQVASQLGMERATISRGLDLLETRNLLKRTHNLSDRRVVEIELTAKGRKLAQTGSLHLEQTFKEVVDNLSATDLNSFVNTLQAIRETLEKNIGR
jgi:DNA-binding MarR family transcriptional regulator